MKNICLILVGLTFLSVLPSYATKIIVNNDKDRIVYSRSSRPPKEIITQPEYTQNTVQNTENDNNISTDGNPKRSWIYYKSVTNPDYNWSITNFVDDIREELIGTRWNYPRNMVTPVSEETIDKYLSGETMTFIRQGLPKGNQTIAEENVKEVTYIEDERFKRTSREAADYYMVDMVKAPNTLVPSWVPEE